MATGSPQAIGRNVATARRMARMTQQQLAAASGVSYGMVRGIERGSRLPGDGVLGAIADALGVDPSRLLGHRARTDSRVHGQLPVLSRTIAVYDIPGDGPVRPLPELRAAVTRTVNWRLAAQYLRIAEGSPGLIAELARGLQSLPSADRPQAARLLVAVLRSADAVAYKFGAHDLSARLVELMRWAVPQAEDPLLDAVVAYVRTETFFAARAYKAGLRALEAAIDAAPAAETDARAVRGTLHMRAAVIAGRAGDTEAAARHLDHAREYGDAVPEAVYHGTAFGPFSVRVHEVSVAVSLGDRHPGRALDLVAGWSPPRSLTAERRSGFYIEAARAQLWAGLRDDAFASLKAARHIAPQHAREHPWVRDDIATLRRLKRAHCEDLSTFADWCHAV